MIETINIATYFPSLTEQRLRAEILDKGVLFSFTAGDILIDYGRYISDIPLILKGGLRILKQEGVNGRELFLYHLTVGQTCAMSLSCYTQIQSSQIKAIAEDCTELIMIPAENMEIWLKKYPTWKNFIFKTYQQSYDKLINSIEVISFQKLEDRLLAYLQGKVHISGKISFQITHQEIANELNSSREVISRQLKKMEKEKILELSRNQIRMLVV